MGDVWESDGVVVETWESSTEPGVTFTTVIREGDIVTGGSGGDLSDAAPQDLGTAAAGVSDEASRADHVHDMPTAADVGADPAGTAAGLVDDLSGVSNQAQARTNLGLGSAAVADTGTGSSNVILGNDSRLTDARTPTTHAATHADGGSDEISIDASQLTTGTVAQDRLGTGSSGAGTKFLADDQTYKTVPSNGITAVISSATFPGYAPIGPNHAPTGAAAPTHGLGGLGREAYAPFFCPAGTYDAIGVLSTVAAVSTWRLGIDDNTAGWPGAVLLDAGTVNMNATVGWQVITGLTFTVTHPRWLWTHVKCVAYTASPTVQCLEGVGAASSSPRIPGWPTYSSLPARALVGAISYINSGSAGVLTAAGPIGPNSATQVGFAQTTPLILLRRSS